MDEDAAKIIPQSIQEEIMRSLEREGIPLVRVLYSSARDLYRVPAMDKAVWLSVVVYPAPAPVQPASNEYVGAAMTADGKAYRRAYSLDWPSVIAGDQATLPANDPMVLDYEAFSQLSLIHHSRT